jgi:thiol:disulfide interchange protein
MRTLRRALGGVLAALLCLTIVPARTGNAAPEAPAPEAKVSLQDVSYDALCKLVRDNKGKVIVVDFWAEY